MKAFKNFSLKLICIDIITVFLTFVSMKTGHMSLYKICFLISVAACNYNYYVYYAFLCLVY